MIRSMAREAGSDVKIKAMEFASSLQAGYAGDFEAYLIGWSGRADPDGNMWQLMHGGGTFNYGRYQNDDVDKALDDARTAASVERRRAFYAKVWDREHEDPPLIYLRAPAGIVGLKLNYRFPPGVGRSDPAAGHGNQISIVATAAGGLHES